MPNIINRIFRKFAYLTDNILEQIPGIETLDMRRYKSRVRAYDSNLPLLDSLDSKIVASLEQQGVVITSLDELGISRTAGMLSAAQALMPHLLNSAVVHEHHYYIHATADQLLANPDIFLWGLDERLLKIVENYIRLPISYQGSFFSRNLKSRKEIGSRLWHIDLEDYRSFKVIVYLHDVFEGRGPFQYIPRPLTAEILYTLKQKYRYSKIKRFPADIMRQIIPASEWKICSGAAGTVVIVDTSNVYHRGMLPYEADRVAIFYEYLSARPRRPHHCKRLFSPSQFSQIINGLTPEQVKCAEAAQLDRITRLS